MIQAVLEPMLERGFGRIINISSVVGETGAFGQANYAASKSGMYGLTKSLALETVRKGITVNCVAPGYTDTDMVAAVPSDVLEALYWSSTSRRFPSAASAAPTRSPGSSTSSPRTTPPTSPAPSSRSTADSKCDLDGRE